jgi:hypothetical protein
VFVVYRVRVHHVKMKVTGKSPEEIVAIEAARRAAIDGEALCNALGIESRGEEAPVEVFRFVADRFAWHYDKVVKEKAC